MTLAIAYPDIEASADGLKGHVMRTPLSEATGRRTLVKFEGAQHTGSFKFRGAFNHPCGLPSAWQHARRPRGAVC